MIYNFICLPCLSVIRLDLCYYCFRDNYLSNNGIMCSSSKPPITLNLRKLHTCVFSYLPNLMRLTIAGRSSFSVRYCGGVFVFDDQRDTWLLGQSSRIFLYLHAKRKQTIQFDTVNYPENCENIFLQNLYRSIMAYALLWNWQREERNNKNGHHVCHFFFFFTISYAYTVATRLHAQI